MTDPTKTNIHYLNLEEPKLLSKEISDPSKEITDQDWQQIKEGLEFPTEISSGISRYIRGVVELKVLFPDRDLDLDTQTWVRAKQMMDLGVLTFSSVRNVFASDFNEAVISIANVMQLFPEKSEEIRSYYQKLKEEAKKRNFDIARELKLFYHPETEDELDYLSSVALIAPEDLSSYQQQLQTSKPGFSRVIVGQVEFLESLDIAREIIGFRTIYPKENINLTKQLWQVLENRLKDEQKLAREAKEPTNWANFARIACMLKLLLAEEVKVTNHNVELIMPEPKPSFKEEIPALPEVRKF
ncbi:MAG: hypothetical protein Q7R49_01855 [Candidatus Daviesbacteria bacterium]|nr:hypothetical protein [Candidatus Daviesbacteria bacterium]